MRNLINNSLLYKTVHNEQFKEVWQELHPTISFRNFVYMLNKNGHIFSEKGYKILKERYFKYD